MYQLEFGHTIMEFERQRISICSSRLSHFDEKHLVASDLNHIQKIILQKPWWDTIDLISSHLMGFLLQKSPEIKTVLHTWNTSNHLWLQRSVILSQLKSKQNTDLVFLEEVIVYHASSKEFFINKAIGWMLRELAKTHESIVKSWLSRHPFAPLTVREASKHFN